MVENSQEYRLKYWATRSSVRSFARTAHFAHSLARGTVNDWMAILSELFSIIDHSGKEETQKRRYGDIGLPSYSSNSGSTRDNHGCTLVQNGLMLAHPIIHSLTSWGGSELVRERASKRMSAA